MNNDTKAEKEETRAVSWIKAAQKDFQKFPAKARLQILTALEIAAAGQKADIAKPMKGLDVGVMEVALKHKTDAFRAVYALKLDDNIWVVHAFKKKSIKGIKTPKVEIDKIRARIKALKEILKDD